MNTKTIITIFKKELKDTIRDRRTLLAMVVMPMLLMPVMTIGMFKFMEYQMEKQAEKIVKISIIEKGEAPVLVEMIKNEEKIEIVETDGKIKKAITDGDLDLGIIIPENFQENIANQEIASITVIQKSTNSDSESALARISFLVANFNDQLLQERFVDQEINPKILSRVVIVPEDMATEKETGGFILGLIIPLFIVLWSITGGQYTAIDVSAGEKERKTLESLLLTPVKRMDIVFGKFLTVSTVALVSVIVAIGSFYAALIYSGGFGPIMQNGQSSGAESIAVNFSIDPQAILLLLAVSCLILNRLSGFSLCLW